MSEWDICDSKAKTFDCGIPDSSGSVFCKILESRMDGDRVCIFKDKYKKLEDKKSQNEEIQYTEVKIQQSSQ